MSGEKNADGFVVSDEDVSAWQYRCRRDVMGWTSWEEWPYGRAERFPAKIGGQDVEYRPLFAQSHGVAGAVKVPDAKTCLEYSDARLRKEAIGYLNGWNACRAAMLDASTQEQTP